MKKAIVILLIVFLVSAVVIVGVIAFGISNNVGFNFDGSNIGFFKGFSERNTYEINQEERYSIEGIKNITLDSVMSEINIIPYDENEIYCHFYGNLTSFSNAEPELILKANGNNVDIRIQYNKRFTNSVSSDLTIDLYLPEEDYDRLNINSVSGDIDVENINTRNLEIDSVSGSITISNSITEDIDIDNVSGQLEILNSKVINIKLNTVSGGIDIINSELMGDIILESISGRIRVDNIIDYNHNLEIDSISGSIDSGDLIINIIEKDKNDLRGTIGDGKYDFDANTISGSIKFN